MSPPSWNPPPCVLLNRFVDLIFDDDDDDESSSAAVESEMVGTEAPLNLIPAIHEATVAMLGSMKPDAALLLPPPEISTLRLRGSKSRRASLSSSTALVACADKGLLVLYGGNYSGPGSSTRGCYLVYDAAAAAGALLSTVLPPALDRFLDEAVGSGAVVLRCNPNPGGGGPSSATAYLLAELAITPKRRFPDPDAALLLWRSDQHPTPRWARKEVHLPREVCGASDRHTFCSDTSFAGPGGCLCWVDLLQGVVVCTNPEDPELRFVPLPDGCPAVSRTDHPYRPRAQENRSAACVGGGRVIKLVAMVGELAGWNAHQYRLTTWTLSPDLREWQQDGVFHLEDIWATDEFRRLNLPELQTPVCPVLSAREDGLVYALVNDIEEHPVVQGRQGVLRTELEFKRQFVLGIDVRRNKIVSTSSGVPPESLMQMMPRLLSIDFCATTHDSAEGDQVMSVDCACMLPNMQHYSRHYL